MTKAEKIFAVFLTLGGIALAIAGANFLGHDVEFTIPGMNKPSLPTEGGLQGVVIDPRGAPVGDVLLRAWRVTDQARELKASGTNGADGTFKFVRLPPGSYTLTAAKEGLMYYWLESIEVRAGPPTHVGGVALTPAEPMTAAIVEGGSGVPGAEVRIQRAGTGGSEDVFETRSDRDGKARWPALPNGPYWIHVRKDGYAESTQAFQAAQGKADIKVELTRQR